MNNLEEKTYDIKKVHISTLQHGDTIIWENKLTTVSKHNFKKGGFLGCSLYGDCLKYGAIPVDLVLFKNHNK